MYATPATATACPLAPEGSPERRSGYSKASRKQLAFPQKSHTAVPAAERQRASRNARGIGDIRAETLDTTPKVPLNGGLHNHAALRLMRPTQPRPCRPSLAAGVSFSLPPAPPEQCLIGVSYLRHHGESAAAVVKAKAER